MSWNSNRNSRASGTSENMMARDNQNLTDQLSGKVNRLKMLALDMEDEVNDHNRYLNTMDSDFEGTTGLLSGSIKRVGYMIGATTSNKKYMCYMILFIVSLFIFVYYIVMGLRHN